MGDIIYEFSSLLRNNISDGRVTTVKWARILSQIQLPLYEVRYQNRLPYGLIDPGLEKDEDLNEAALKNERLAVP